MHGQPPRRWIPRLSLVLAHVLVVTAAVGLLTGWPGPVAAPDWLPRPTGDEGRRAALVVLAVVYLLRATLTTTRLLRREVDWQEVLVVGPWLALLHGALAWLGGTNPRPLSAMAGLGAGLFAVGTILGPAAEWTRLRWKLQPGHEGHLYTEGLFRRTMHPNYLADVLLFTGWALVAGTPLALAVPLLVLVGFVLIHIPTLDRYLESRYGAEFRTYAERTSHLVPGIW